jgi:hypothetical protein
VTTSPPRLVRRIAVVLAAAAAGVAVAGPAGAAVPEGWPQPPPVSALHALLVLAGIPLLLFVAITLLVLIPSLIRGERAPGAHAAGDQWFGGPRQGTAELAQPDTEQSEAGGASARW